MRSCGAIGVLFASVFDDSLAHELECAAREVGEVGKDVRGVGGLQAEPVGECGSVLVGRGLGDPVASIAGVVGGIQREGGKLSVDLTALYGAAHHHVMAAPGVVGARVAVGLEGPAEFGFGKGGYIVHFAQLSHGCVERRHGRCQIPQQLRMLAELVGVGVIAALAAE